MRILKEGKDRRYFDTYPERLSFGFTDFSSVSDEDVKRIGSSRVHMFGGSMSLGLLGKQSRAWTGLAGAIGHATANRS